MRQHVEQKEEDENRTRDIANRKDEAQGQQDEDSEESKRIERQKREQNG
jgi:hypothetical protein